jgi:ribosomal protein S16
MRIFLRTVKAKPYVVNYIFAGDPQQKDNKNEKIGIFEPKAEGKAEKLELNIERYDELYIAGATPTESIDKLRRTISPPPPDLSAPASEESETETESEPTETEASE